MNTSIFLSYQGAGILLLVIFIILPVAVFLLIVLPIIIVRHIYDKFVSEHSVAIKELREINSRYTFRKVKLDVLKHDYDNETFFNTISPQDYLTYQLQFTQKQVLQNISNASFNNEMFEQYSEEIKKIKFGSYDTDEVLNSDRLMLRAEKRVFNKLTQDPVTEYLITVFLRFVRMNGRVEDTKGSVFYPEKIKSIINRLNYKRGERYLDDKIWASLCRVERGKVTNKMRFYIYDRDGHRCKMCHRRARDLEIDHIWPISKGGKSTIDNLQTLCHKCNAKKGNSVVY